MPHLVRLCQGTSRPLARITSVAYTILSLQDAAYYRWIMDSRSAYGSALLKPWNVVVRVLVAWQGSGGLAGRLDIYISLSRVITGNQD